MMLDLVGICAGYGPINVLHDVNIHVVEKEIVSIIGANGAGKSTLLRTISGLLPCRRGSMKYKGEDFTHSSSDRIVKMGVVQVPEVRGIFAPLTVSENLTVSGYALGAKWTSSERRKRFNQVFELFPVLSERLAQKAGTLSGGEQQMLAIARALIPDPSLLLLDEPSLGLAPIIVERIFDVFQRLNREGRTILLVEQNARIALTISNRAYLLDVGEVVLEGKAETLLNDPKVKEVYLGGMEA